MTANSIINHDHCHFSRYAARLPRPCLAPNIRRVLFACSTLTFRTTTSTRSTHLGYIAQPAFWEAPLVVVAAATHPTHVGHTPARDWPPWRIPWPADCVVVAGTRDLALGPKNRLPLASVNRRSGLPIAPLCIPHVGQWTDEIASDRPRNAIQLQLSLQHVRRLVALHCAIQACRLPVESPVPHFVRHAHKPCNG